MSKIKLNNKLLQTLMERSGVTAKELAAHLGVSKQMMNYIIHHGGLKYAAALAKRFDCKESDLTHSPPPREKGYSLPPGFELVKGVLRRKNRKIPRGFKKVNGRLRRIKKGEGK